jgi:hypothetical protein
MRNILTFIGVTVVLVICSIADFDLGPDAERRWNATQQATRLRSACPWQELSTIQFTTIRQAVWQYCCPKKS